MRINRRNRQSRYTAGFTLIEATLALVILSVAAAGVLLPFVGGVAVQTEGLHRTLAAELANNLMEQIVNTPYEEIIKDTGEIWDGWDGYTESQGEVRDASGTIFTDSIYADYSRDVSCEYVYVDQQGDEDPPCFFILATVRVYCQGVEIATVNRLISE
jgi:prepilin-type N-terminal cleavage/methylation domain-containing protein